MVDTQGDSARKEHGEHQGSRLSWYKDSVLLSTVPAVLLMDQLSKYLVQKYLPLGQSWPSDGLLRLTHGTNSGSAFGLFPNMTPVLIVASVVAIGFVAYFYRVHAMPKPLLRFAVGLLLGGAVGNLIDRLRFGTVVDFIDVGWWPIFNLADSSIVVGVTLLVAVLFLGDRKARSAAEPVSGSSEGAAGR